MTYDSVQSKAFDIMQIKSVKCVLHCYYNQIHMIKLTLYLKKKCKPLENQGLVETTGLDLIMEQPPRKPAAGNCPLDSCI